MAGQPNRIRCVRDQRWKYAVYLDPAGSGAPEYELYDLESDPDEALNLAHKRTGRGSIATNTLTPELPPARG